MRPLILLALVTLVAACATSGNGRPQGCVVPSSICQTTIERSFDAPPTCGLCAPVQLVEWSRQTGCEFAGAACAGGGTIYLDNHQYYCCQECPDECDPRVPGQQ